MSPNSSPGHVVFSDFPDISKFLSHILPSLVLDFVLFSDFSDFSVSTLSSPRPLVGHILRQSFLLEREFPSYFPPPGQEKMTVILLDCRVA